MTETYKEKATVDLGDTIATEPALWRLQRQILKRVNRWAFALACRDTEDPGRKQVLFQMYRTIMTRLLRRGELEANEIETWTPFGQVQTCAPVGKDTAPPAPIE